LLHPADLETFLTAWEHGLAGTAPWEAEGRFRRGDGEYRWLLVRYTPLIDDGGRIVRWYSTGTDIHDRKKAEEKVQQDGRELRQLLDLVPQQIFVLDGDLVPAYANRELLEYHGATFDDVPPDAALANQIVHHPDDVARLWEESQRAIAKGTPFETEARVLGKTGEYRWFLIRRNPFRDANGEIVRWYGTRTDIDDRKKAE